MRDQNLVGKKFLKVCHLLRICFQVKKHMMHTSYVLFGSLLILYTDSVCIILFTLVNSQSNAWTSNGCLKWREWWSV